MRSYSHGYLNLNIKNLLNYAQILSVKYHFFSAISGFFIMLAIVMQLISGTLLSFSLIPESMIVPIVRDEEDLEDLYVDDFF